MTKKTYWLSQNSRFIYIRLFFAALFLTAALLVFARNNEKVNRQNSNEIRQGPAFEKYDNNELEMSLNYPSSYKITERLTEDGRYMSLYSPNSPNRKKESSPMLEDELKVEIVSAKIPETTKLSQLFQVGNDYRDFKSEKIEKVIIGGKEAYKIIADGVGEEILTMNNGYKIQIFKYPLKTTRQPEFEDILNSIIFY